MELILNLCVLNLWPGGCALASSKRDRLFGNDLLNTTRVQCRLVDVGGDHRDLTFQGSGVEVAPLLLRDVFLQGIVAGVRRTGSIGANWRRRS